jgi:LacI family transcriptional regulator
MGIAAVRQLLSRLGMNGQLNDLPPQRISLVPHLIERQSSGPVPTHSWSSKLLGK